MVVGSMNDSTANTVVVTATTMALTMKNGQTYRLAASTACWVRFSNNAAVQAAVAGAASNHFVPPNWEVTIVCQGNFDTVSIIRDAADGRASLTQAV